MQTHNERGIAMILALFLMTALSALGASLMFLSQTETYASQNYRMMSQGRYAAEAGIQRAAGFLFDNGVGGQYAFPKLGGNGVGDDLNNYNRTVSPVTYMGQPVILSATALQASNYPVAAVRTAFAAAAQGTLAVGNANVAYNAYATLLSMQQFEAYGSGPAVVQTWRITGVGSVTGGRTATVEVVALVETPKVPANSYAAFATDNGCGAMYFHGNVTIDSYDSRIGPPTGAGNSTENSGGDVGTNGNLIIQGSTEVQGNLYTPRTGVGACTAGAVTGLTVVGSADLCAAPPCVSVSDSMIQLPTEVHPPLPTFTVSLLPTVTINAATLAVPAAACASLGLVLGTNCSVSGSTVTIDANSTEISLPSVVVSGGYKVVFNGDSPANVVNINSLTGSGDVEIAANMSGPANESVVLKVSGKNPDNSEIAVPFDLSTMSWKQNSPANSYDASALQIIYGGSAVINMKGGNSQSAATIYAPNAEFHLQGTQDLYGSILARTIENHGNASIHYDRRLAREFFIPGHPMGGSFSWARF